MTLNIACVQRRGIDLLVAGYQLYFYVNNMQKISNAHFAIKTAGNSQSFQQQDTYKLLRVVMCHQSKGLAQRSLIHELNVMRGKELQRYNRPHSETFTCEVCSYVRIQ